MFINDETTIIKIPTVIEKDLIFADPYISRKGFLTFKASSTDYITAEYDFEKKVLVLKTSKQKVGVKLEEDQKSWLNDLYSKEFIKVNDFFARGMKGDIELLISNRKNVDTIELIDNCFNPYYIKVFEYVVNNYLDTKDLDYFKLTELLLSKIDLSKYSLIDNDGWKYQLVPLTDIKK